MRYFKNDANELFVYDENTAERYIAKGLTEITQAQYDALSAETPDEIETKRLADITAEADQIILNAYSKGKQDKIMMEAIYLTHESKSRALTTEEDAFMGWAVSVRNWIKSVRDIENACQADPNLPVDFSGIAVAP